MGVDGTYPACDERSQPKIRQEVAGILARVHEIPGLVLVFVVGVCLLLIFSCILQKKHVCNVYIHTYIYIENFSLAIFWVCKKQPQKRKRCAQCTSHTVACQELKLQKV